MKLLSCFVLSLCLASSLALGIRGRTDSFLEPVEDGVQPADLVELTENVVNANVNATATTTDATATATSTEHGEHTESGPSAEEDDTPPPAPTPRPKGIINGGFVINSDIGRSSVQITRDAVRIDQTRPLANITHIKGELEAIYANKSAENERRGKYWGIPCVWPNCVKKNVTINETAEGPVISDDPDVDDAATGATGTEDDEEDTVNYHPLAGAPATGPHGLAGTDYPQPGELNWGTPASDWSAPPARPPITNEEEQERLPADECHGHGQLERGACVCHEGFSGADCHLDVRDGKFEGPSRCEHGSFDEHGHCQCFEGFYGYHCHKLLPQQPYTAPPPPPAEPHCPHLDKLNCTNGGAPNNESCECDCMPPWSGEDCTTCAFWRTQCENGGTYNADTCGCTCHGPWGGTICDICQPLECQHGGTFDPEVCACQCAMPWTGHACEFTADGKLPDEDEIYDGPSEPIVEDTVTDQEANTTVEDHVPEDDLQFDKEEVEEPTSPLTSYNGEVIPEHKVPFNMKTALSHKELKKADIATEGQKIGCVHCYQGHREYRHVHSEHKVIPKPYPDQANGDQTAPIAPPQTIDVAGHLDTHHEVDPAPAVAQHAPADTPLAKAEETYKKVMAESAHATTAPAAAATAVATPAAVPTHAPAVIAAAAVAAVAHH